jgi:branched-chain amino acid transport system permease protein
MAHGSLYMLGAYIAYSCAAGLGGPLGFWGGMLAAALAVAILGALIELLLLRRIYHVVELFQLLATFALVLIVSDVVAALWGVEDLLGPRAPGQRGSVEILGHRFPEYDLFLLVLGPVALAALYLLLTRTRWGTLVRAATQDRDMVAALGVDQAKLFTAVFALGAGLAALGGALQIAREPANLGMDLSALGDAFVVVVVGGMGSIPGAYVAALLIAEIKAICIALGTQHLAGVGFNFSKLTLVAEFIVMATVLIVRPYGLFGRAQGMPRHAAALEDPLEPAGRGLKAFALAVLLALVALPLAG